MTAPDTVSSLYRKLVSALHPDRAKSDADAKLRTVVMQRVNRARESQDLHALKALHAEFGGLPPAPPRPAAEKPAFPRAADINPWKLQSSVLTDEGWVCPAR